MGVILVHELSHATRDLHVVVLVQVGKGDAHAAFRSIEAGTVHEHDTLLLGKVVEEVDVGNRLTPPCHEVVPIALPQELVDVHNHIVLRILPAGVRLEPKRVHQRHIALVHHRLGLLDVRVVVWVDKMREREQVHENLGGRGQPAGVIQTDGAAVGTQTLDERHLVGIGSDDVVLLRELRLVLVGQTIDQAVHHVVLVHGNHADAPSRGSVELGVRVHEDGVVRQHAVDSLEVAHERAVHVVGEDYEVGVLLHHPLQALERRVRQRMAGWV